MRREWIEIAGLCSARCANGSPSMRREWIEMCMGGDKMYILDESPSMRREWIEM